jgi:hypothetical protein
MNDFDTEERLFVYLDELDLLNGERLRPGWDTYFMVRPTLSRPPAIMRALTLLGLPDPGFARFTAVKLHEAPSRCSPCPVEADISYWIQRHPSRVDQLQRRRLLEVQWRG